MTKESNTLDPLSKILVATSAINYLSNALYSVNKDIKTIVHLNPDQREIFENSILQREDVLFDTVKKLGVIMEQLGNILNDHDSICKIDRRITDEAFKIIIHGKDNIE